MTLLRQVWAPLVLASLLGCTAAPDRYVVPTPAATDRQSIAFRTVEIREVSLPAYAASDEISLQDEGGRLATVGDGLWADTPERAVSLALARHLAELSGRTVASAPWPLESFPDARLDVRFETLTAEETGTFRARGQYFVAVGDGRRERAGLFDLAVPFDPAGGAGAIATARGQIILDLARDLAARALR
ncbi:ABC-type transport auxiliary lipoprotein family protein [uncultured Roseobacter sp.]|uniref:PqiC family protein n=1 Tax=uncultured Roseobacter sp. TaxID=114847 RepID=UPI0026281B2F|nr:ABC-type transport auxiliary lipoprotein family protein [uncultured Roseobacter sp.]